MMQSKPFYFPKRIARKRLRFFPHAIIVYTISKNGKKLMDFGLRFGSQVHIALLEFKTPKHQKPKETYRM